MNRRLPDEERRARAAAQRQAWHDANPNYRAEYRAQNLEKIRTDNRERERHRREAERRRQHELERAREWARANPEKRKATRDRYREKDPERARAQSRASYHRNKERNKEAVKARRDLSQSHDPEKLREDRRRYNAAARAKRAEPRPRPGPEQRERDRVQQLATKRMAARLKRAGLPPRQVQKTLASVRRVNLAQAEEFFSRARSRAEVRRITSGDVVEGTVTPAMTRAWADYLRQLRARRELVPAVRAYIATHGGRLREEIGLDSRARQVQGREPLDVDAEVWRRAVETVSATRITPAALRQTEPLRTGGEALTISPLVLPVAVTATEVTSREQMPEVQTGRATDQTSETGVAAEPVELAERVRLFANLDRPLRGSDLTQPPQPAAAGKARDSSVGRGSREVERDR